MFARQSFSASTQRDSGVDAPPTRRGRGRRSVLRRALAPVLTGVVATAGMVMMAPAEADHLGTFYGLELFAPEGAARTNASCGPLTTLSDMATTEQLPSGTTAQVVLQGRLQRVTAADDRGCRVWTLGGNTAGNCTTARPCYSVAAPRGVSIRVPARGRQIRILAAAKVATPTKLVAEKIVNRNRAGTDVDYEIAYVANLFVVNGDAVSEDEFGDCTSTARNPWTVRDGAGHLHTLDVSAARAGDEIEPCLGEGSTITAEFDRVLPADD